MALHITANAIFRSFFSRPIYGSLEITQFWYMPLIVFGGLAVAQMRSEHIEATLFYDRLSEPAQRWLRIATTALSLVVVILFAFYSSQMARESMAIRRSGGVIGIPIWPATFIVSLGFLGLAGVYVRDLWNDVLGSKERPS